jgi:hypothetical protein
MGRDVAALELACRQSGVDVGVGREVDNLDAVETGLLEQALLGRDVPLAVAEPRLDAHLDVTRFRRCGNRLSQAIACRCGNQNGCSTGCDELTPARTPSHDRPPLGFASCRSRYCGGIVSATETAR